MKINSYLTFLSRNKAYTAINVFGLSVSLMFVVLIGLYYEHETGVDQQIPDKERVVLVHPAEQSGTSRGIIPLLRKQLPQIQSACALFSMTNRHVQFAQDDYAKCDMLYVDSTYYDVFGFTLLQGDPHTALADEQSVVLEEELARKLFPQGDAMGKPLTLNDKYKVFVRGIYRRTENSSIPQDDIVGRYELLREELPYFFNGIMGNFGSPDVYLKLNEGTDYKELIPQVNKILTEAYAQIGAGLEKLTFSLSPVADLYFSDYGSNVCRRGEPELVMLIAIIGLIILAFAVMNYINLTVAQAGRRAKEMATRRLLGSQKRDIMVRMVLESTSLCAVSVAVSLLLAVAAIPYTNQLLETHISAMQLLSPLNMLFIVGTVVLLGAVAGIVPAQVMSAVQPIDVVRGTFRVRTKTTLGRAFMTVQHFITIVLVAITGIFTHHTLHMIHAPLGYETDSLMAFRIQQNAQKAMLFKQKLKALPGVENASVCFNVPLNGGFNNMGETETGKIIRFQRLYGDEDYLATLGIELKEKWGNGEYMNTYVSTDFHSTLGITPGTRTFKWKPIDQELMDIHGLLADFSLGTSRHQEHEESPEVTIVYEHKEYNDNLPNFILIRVRGDKKETLEAVKQIYKEVYREDFTDSMPWMQQSVAAAFQAESRLLTILSCFAGVALLISVLGLVAMSTYHIQQRRKEIAVRKVFGSSVAQVRRRLIGQFLAHVAVAALPAVPLVWWVAREYMATQVVRIVWWPWIIIAVAVVLLVSWLAVAVQSRMAAAEKPVNHIKDNE
ncbi:MAG: FtsX-like permease family protein [Bacteroidaceae bacterium]|nr:FtsX-like permease family protein [Bacteroidaceae bacterium]